MFNRLFGSAKPSPPQSDAARPIVGFTLAADGMPEIVARGRIVAECETHVNEGYYVARPQSGHILIELVPDDA